MGAARKERSAGGRAGRWLLAAFLVLLALSLALRYAPGLGERWSALWARGRGAGAPSGEPGAGAEDAALAAQPAIPLRLQILNATGVSRLALERGKLRHGFGVGSLGKPILQHGEAA
jgi:hypothetical protein